MPIQNIKPQDKKQLPKKKKDMTFEEFDALLTGTKLPKTFEFIGKNEFGKQDTLQFKTPKARLDYVKGLELLKKSRKGAVQKPSERLKERKASLMNRIFSGTATANDSSLAIGTGLLKEPKAKEQIDFDKEIESIDKKIGTIDKSLTSFEPGFREDKGIITRAETLGGKPVFKRKVRDEQSRERLQQRKQGYLQQLQNLQQQKFISTEAKRIGISPKELINKISGAEQLVRNIHTNPPKFLFRDPQRQREALIEHINQQLQEKFGMDLEDFNYFIKGK